ncbi:hypothetical protein SAMN05421809_2251 [Natronorubrum daqingense]|uniref:Uncharacterized protein n=1 Tax=Natronorubrum daqingense TaxID=588898 RepID=A0A1N7DUL6_9EURY|nr:hypothetical protein SAMN05421809_2251 [Natronorubrum daqingense]
MRPYYPTNHTIVCKYVYNNLVRNAGTVRWSVDLSTERNNSVDGHVAVFDGDIE